jgi:hypothetical protein
MAEVLQPDTSPDPSIEYWQGMFNRYATLQNQFNKLILDKFGFDLVNEPVYQLPTPDKEMRKKVGDLQFAIAHGLRYYSNPQDAEPEPIENLEKQFEQLTNTLNS